MYTLFLTWIGFYKKKDLWKEIFKQATCTTILISTKLTTTSHFKPLNVMHAGPSMRQTMKPVNIIVYIRINSEHESSYI